MHRVSAGSTCINVPKNCLDLYVSREASLAPAGTQCSISYVSSFFERKVYLFQVAPSHRPKSRSYLARGWTRPACIIKSQKCEK
jgi:hypothetical protein